MFLVWHSMLLYLASNGRFRVIVLSSLSLNAACDCYTWYIKAHVEPPFIMIHIHSENICFINVPDYFLFVGFITTGQP